MQSSDRSLPSLCNIIAAYNSEADLALIRRAHDHAASALAGQRLLDYAQAMTRSLAVAHTLAQLRVDEIVIAAGLLFEAVMSTQPVDDIGVRFGEEVADILASAVGIRLLEGEDAKVSGNERTHVIRRGMSADIKAFLVVLADHLEIMRFLEYQPSQRREGVVLDTWNIYLPLVQRLSLHGIEKELAALCFRYLRPEEFSSIHGWQEQRRSTDVELLNEACDILRTSLEEMEIQADVEGTLKSAYSLYKEMKTRDLLLSELPACALNIIVQSKQDCYAVLGVCYNAWKPLFDRFQDHIGTPVVAMDQSLRTTVFGPQGTLLELRIRTAAMDRQAASGALGYWWSEEGARDQGRDADWSHALDDAPYQEDDDLAQGLFWEPFLREIYVFTPKGEVITLPKDATSVDFAYKIHTEVGNRCIGARVNDALVPLSTPLRRGDIVEIIYSVNEGPSRHWLDFVTTRRARKQIRRYSGKRQCKRTG